MVCAMDTEQLINKKSEYWMKKLIDLSKRNNLVNYRFTKSKSLKIVKPNFESIIDDLNSESKIFIQKGESKVIKKCLWLSSEKDDEDNKKELKDDKKLTNLYRKAAESFKELGINTCFVSIGILKYTESKNSDLFYQAPIFLYPVTINRISTTSRETHSFELVGG
ncbi:DUF4011 domain-containing protein, partial [Candidatus Woesearchaeota archaeon]|nr:DUF4011 domain-containing protein [Candidatus Woesearchaeota archaeon]